eukprot:CAMPEP_0198283954 /NCGR_PEP_ID=MMETSP1449-20131203/3530_1 /TAXON_ID=420275 /ORGANISM="Attheya septentrionalis, Strain CCMP2084" /LENGTH=458 /DNA_ID=CAMNT_0043980859 /DNA_START=228 /DNA_END=1601 /DNA_ORIENTATION=-
MTGVPNVLVRLRGGGGVAPPSSSSSTRLRVGASAASPSASDADPAAKFKKMRISAFDSMRFILIMAIVCGHFIQFANPSEFIRRLASNHNVLVGAFFALSGYVTAYTSTENAKMEPSQKLVHTPKQKWILSRVFGYYPLHLLVLVLFSPLFLFVDLHYNGWSTALINGILSVTMTQAWFPMNAEICNAPTWFLSSLTFATAIMPFCLPSIAYMNKMELRKTGFWIFMVYVLPKIGYAYDLNTWQLAEGLMISAKAHPNLAIFNMQRFSPLFVVAEVLLGVIACRFVMLDHAPGEETRLRATNSLSTAVPLATMMGLLWMRATGMLELSDLLFRSVLFVPLFLRFLIAIHRNTVQRNGSGSSGGGSKDPLVTILSNEVLVTLGKDLSFPIYLLHGPIGYLFFKKLVAKQLWGHVLKGPTYFAAYLAVTILSALVLQKTFLQSKTVHNWSQQTVETLSAW